MNRPIAISLSPNTEADDVQRARRALPHPEAWQDPQWVLQAEKMLGEKFPGHHLALTSSGRQALFRVLKALNIGTGDEVILQAFTCIAIPASIIWAGAKPVYADIDPKNYNLDPVDVERKIKPTTKAIIIQHTFGIPGPVRELQAIAQKNNLFLIEDFAHGFQELIGDAAILSFGRDKIISSVFGGAVVSRKQDLIERIRDQQRALPYPPPKWVRQQLRHPLAINTILRWYFVASLGKALLVALQKICFLSKAVAPEEKFGEKPDHFQYRFSPALAYLLINQIDKLDRYTARRQEIVSQYIAEFSGPSTAQLRFPLQRENAQEIILAARRRGILLGDWYNTPLVPGDSDLAAFGYIPGLCPVAEEVSKRIINLPTYPLLTDEQVQQVIAFIKSHD